MEERRKGKQSTYPSEKRGKNNGPPMTEEEGRAGSSLFLGCRANFRGGKKGFPSVDEKEVETHSPFS